MARVLYQFVLLFVLVSTKTFAGYEQKIQNLKPKIDAAVERAIQKWRVPGAAIAIVSKDKVLYQKTIGLETIGTKHSVTDKSLFPVASVTKNFTATLVAHLISKGKLKWEDKISDYLPEFKLGEEKATKALTVKDVFTHLSGLPAFSTETLWNLGWSADEMMAALAQLPLQNEVGQNFAYQNILIGVVGKMIEKALHTNFPDLIYHSLFQPLGLKDSYIATPQQFKPKLTFYEQLKSVLGQECRHLVGLHDIYKDQVRLRADNPHLFEWYASTGVVTTLNDLQKWLQFQLGLAQGLHEDIVSKEQVKFMQTAHIAVDNGAQGKQFPAERVTELGYGIGWYVHNYGGHKCLTHMGGVSGVRSLLMMLPEEDLAMVIISNLGGMRISYFPESLRSTIFDLLFDIKDNIDWIEKVYEQFREPMLRFENIRREQRATNPMPPQTLAQYEGEYTNSLYGILTIKSEGKKLYLAYTKPDKSGKNPEAKVELTHWNGNYFRLNASDLGSGFTGKDIGEVEFGIQGTQPAFALTVSVLFEGHNPVFQRVSH